MVGTTATILAGTNSMAAGNTLSMQWRTRTIAESTPGGTGVGGALISDVVRLTGMAGSGTSQTDPFVLQMNYDPSQISALDLDPQDVAQAGYVFLAWRNPSSGLWVNAVAGNFGGTATFMGVGAFSALGDTNPADDLGYWGVDAADDTVWAVVDHNSDFAADVVPEPATLCLLALGGLAMLRRRK